MADWDGAGYVRVSGLQRAMATASLDALTVAGDERVLDVGCGDGYVTRQIAARVPAGSVVGVDASPRMIDTARAADDRAKNVSFQVGDVTTMAFGPDFDLVVSFNALHWVPDQQAAFRNIAAALDPYGRVLVQFVCHGPRPSVERVTMEVCRDPRWAPAFAGFAPPYVHIDPDDLAGIAGSAGLDVTGQSVADREWDFGSREQFAQWCAVGFTDWTSRLPAADGPVFIDAVVDRYQAVVGRPGLFRFLQLRAELRPSPAAARSAAADSGARRGRF
ncbi:SAM-dependent methyltransferase [Catellatospora sp. TT07R-123]|uniref:class I SAM-dependent methyltransferase n=1 Tax=Catellatospora sp. TT07R-123 TaxID=2733863 RepID=UPI001B046A42|nr:class I SAM-dependent methyltransferase [Catellatospora sp. TT07R-123]GHJ47085.1 SAM-dependent methyltransferase [Catellatospora sp. TT07R-123]